MAFYSLLFLIRQQPKTKEKKHAKKKHAFYR